MENPKRRVMHAFWLGRRHYEPVHALQKKLVEFRAAESIEDILLFLEHRPVVTVGRALGRGVNATHLRASPEELAQLGVELIETGRGGDITYHGPGQLVAYPIFNLKPDRCDVRCFVRDLCEVMIRLAAGLGIGAGTLPALIGAWVDRSCPERWLGEALVQDAAKIGAIGVRLSRWVSMHGFAFNGSTDLQEFHSLIVPCGIADRSVTSVAELVGSSPSVLALAERAMPHFADIFCADVHSFYDLSEANDTALEKGITDVAHCQHE